MLEVLSTARCTGGNDAKIKPHDESKEWRQSGPRLVDET